MFALKPRLAACCGVSHRAVRCIAGAVVVDERSTGVRATAHTLGPGHAGNNKFYAFTVANAAVHCLGVALGDQWPQPVTDHVDPYQPGTGLPAGFLLYHDAEVSLSNVKLISLTVTGIQATLQGTADLADGTPVSFTLDARASDPTPTVRLRLSSGYDSGEQRVSLLSIRPSPGNTW